jgi:magnesium transporter
MARFLKDRTKAKGQAPGSLIFIGKQKMDQPIIHIMQYDAEMLIEEQLPSVSEAIAKIKPSSVNWINIYGIHDLQMIKTIGDKLKIPPLILEDILNTDQPPKYEEGESYDGFILKMLSHDEKKDRIHAEQITILLGENYVLTLQEKKGDVFAPVRERIRINKGRVRINNNDYLAYTLMDTIVDNYTLLIEKLGGKVEDLEDRIFIRQDKKIVEEIYRIKTELNYLRKSVRPVKDVMISLMKSENSFFLESNRQYLKDLYDLVVQSADAIELYNNLVSDQLNIYNSSISNGMNEVMKVLTIFASIFIPMTFIAGIYGMNFEYFPELKYKYAYAFFWVVILLIGGGLVLYFKRKKWL